MCQQQNADPINLVNCYHVKLHGCIIAVKYYNFEC